MNLASVGLKVPAINNISTVRNFKMLHVLLILISIFGLIDMFVMWHSSEFIWFLLLGFKICDTMSCIMIEDMLLFSCTCWYILTSSSAFRTASSHHSFPASFSQFIKHAYTIAFRAWEPRLSSKPLLVMFYVATSSSLQSMMFGSVWMTLLLWLALTGTFMGLVSCKYIICSSSVFGRTNAFGFFLETYLAVISFFTLIGASPPSMSVVVVFAVLICVTVVDTFGFIVVLYGCFCYGHIIHRLCCVLTLHMSISYRRLCCLKYWFILLQWPFFEVELPAYLIHVRYPAFSRYRVGLDNMLCHRIDQHVVFLITVWYRRGIQVTWVIHRGIFVNALVYCLL